ncbi:hypothetical protein ABPG77_010949 [Micractinium sp. CCAP 211/92]
MRVTECQAERGTPPAAKGAAAPPQRSSRRREEQPIATKHSRRTTLLSIAGLAWAPGALLDSLRGEAGLWAQEADLYRRKVASALSEATGSQKDAVISGAQQTAAAAGLKLDPALAEVLLAAPLQALSSNSGSGDAAANNGGGAEAAGSPPQLPALDVEQYQRDYAALLKRERPYFEAAGTCGSCGAAGNGGAALSDRSYFDFLSYIQYKALARQLGASVAPAGGGSSTRLSGWERMHAGSPEMQLRAAEAAWQDSLMSQGALLASGGAAGPLAGGGFSGSRDEQLQAAAAAYAARARQDAPKRDSTNAAPPLTAADMLRLSVGSRILAHIEADLAGGSMDSAATLAAVRSTSPQLDDVRAGARALLAWFVSKGFVAAVTLEQFGLSLDEYENHYVWTLGEPAFLKYWVQAPATLRSAAALDTEEGFSQDYIAATLQAYFRRCGVAATSLKRYPSYSQPELVAEQWTLRRTQPLPDGYDWQQYREWAPDSCPGNDEDACY